MKNLFLFCWALLLLGSCAADEAYEQPRTSPGSAGLAFTDDELLVLRSFDSGGETSISAAEALGIAGRVVMSLDAGTRSSGRRIAGIYPMTASDAAPTRSSAEDYYGVDIPEDVILHHQNWGWDGTDNGYYDTGVFYKADRIKNFITRSTEGQTDNYQYKVGIWPYIRPR